MDVSDIEKRITEAVQSRSSDFRKQSDSLTFEGVQRRLEKDMGLESFTLDAHKQLIRQLLEENFYSSEDEEVSASLKDVENDIENRNLGSPKSSREGPETENNGREMEADGEGQSGLNKEITETEEPDQLETNQAEPPKVEIDTKGKGDLSLAENEAIIKAAFLKRTAYLKARADSITLGGVRRLLEQDLQLEKKSLDVHKTLINSLVDQVFGNLSGIQDDVKESKKKQLKKAPKGMDNDLLQKDVKTKKMDGLEDSLESTEISRDDEAMEETSETLKGIKAGKRRKGEGFGNKPLKGRKRKKEPKSEEDRKKVKKVAKKRKAVEGDDVEPLKPVSTTRKGAEDEDTDEEPVRHGISDDSGNDSTDEKVVKVKGKKIAGTTVAHGEQVEHLKKIIKSCGMTVPSAVYKKVKQAPESKQEVSLIQELEEILKREGLSSNPTDKGSSKAESLWLASTPSKRWGEIFFMAYTPFWLILCLGIVVPYRLYERFTELDYLVLGLVSALPSFMLPFVLVGKGDKSKHWFECYWAKASLWIIIFSYVGNYFWTHYFFAVLGASYTFPSWRMNNVPHTTFLLTHACFLFYHVASNITLRRVRHAISDLPSHVQWAIQAIWILTLSYIIALLETFAIANFPYYDFVDRAAMYKVGSLFYAIYFIVSFPMFMRLDEKPNDPWSLSRTAIDALAAAMIVTIILDLWRLFLGPIVEIPTSIPYKECLSYGLPWMS